MDGWTDGRTDGRLDGLMDGWMDGWMDGKIGVESLRETDTNSISISFRKEGRNFFFNDALNTFYLQLYWRQTYGKRTTQIARQETR